MRNITILKQEKYQKTFKPSQLRINGFAKITLWDVADRKATIEMDSFNLPLESIKNESDLINQIKENANDGGSGCQEINELIDVQVDVLSNDGEGCTLCTDSFFYDKI